jgi:hypothetical protein
LETRRLHFARFDPYLDGPWEGVLPPKTAPLPKDHFRNSPLRPGDTLTDFEMHVQSVNRLNKLCSYASCWFINEHESDAMWRLYAPEGVAIRSTFRRLRDSVAHETEPVFIGEVGYFDFRTEQPPTYGNTLAVTFSKRRQFEHERELRAVVVKPPAEWTSGLVPYEEYRDVHPKYMKIDCDLEVLVECVYVAPGLSQTVKTQVHEALRRHGLERQIVTSTLDERPILL